MITTDRNFLIAELLISVALFFFAAYAQKVKNSLFKLCYLLPLAVALFFAWMTDIEISLLPAYIGALLAGAGFVYEKVSVRRTVSVSNALLAVLACMICFLNPAYREPDYGKEFEESFAALRKHYCLTEHKGIDWDALYEKYSPKFQEAKKHHDRVENAMAWIAFASEFHDGHVSYSMDDALANEVQERILGNDYGLSLVLLSDGSVAAADVEKGSKAEAAGLYNGAKVLLWDGKDPKELSKQVQYPLRNMPVLENEAFYNMLYVAGMGGDTVSVRFQNRDGEEKEIALDKTGSYRERFYHTLKVLDDGMKIGTLSFAKVSDDTVLYRISGMSYDSASYVSGDHSAFEAEFRAGIQKYKNEGYQNLILDLRSNGGGSPHMILAMAKVLASKGKHFYCKEALLDEKTCKFVYDEAAGKYVPDGEGFFYNGEDTWSHGKIILIVNGQCVSAGDHFTDIMGEMDNVTIVGTTRSNACGQAVGAIYMTEGSLSYSMVPALDRDGNIFVDPGVDRISHVAFDEKIPLTEEAIVRMFDDGEDYVLNYVLEHYTK